MKEQISGSVRIPWRGTSPFRMIFRGASQVVIFGIIGFYALQVRTGELALDDGLDEYRSGIEGAATAFLVIAGIAVVVGAIQLVVGILDASPRRTVEGVVASAGRRRSGDFLPQAAQHLWYRSRNRSGQLREHRRRSWHELVIDTDGGRRHLTVRPKLTRQADPGAYIRAKVSPILGYVSSVEVVSTAPTGAPVGAPPQGLHPQGQ